MNPRSRLTAFVAALAILSAAFTPAPSFAAKAPIAEPATLQQGVTAEPADPIYERSTVKIAPSLAKTPNQANVISGVKNIPGDYATLALAITDLNAQGVGAGGVTLNLLAGNPQTAPAGGYVIGGAGSLVLGTASAANPITIQGNNNTITAFTPQTVGNINDAIFKLIGADFTTITGFVMQENAGNTISATAATNNMTEFGVALFYVTATDGAQNNTIQGNTITLNRTYRNTFGIYSNVRHTSTSMTTLADATAASGSNSLNRIYGNSIGNVNYGIVFIGAAAAAVIDNGNDIGGGSAATGNILTNFGSSAAALSAYVSLTGNHYGIFVNQQVNDNISFNTLTSAALTNGTVTEGGILKNFSVGQPAGAFSTTINNNTVTITNATTGTTTGIVVGINNQGLTPLNAAATMNIINNTVTVSQGGTTATTAGAVAITNSSLPGTININGNTVINSVITAPSATSATLTAITNSVAAGTLNMQNNILRGMASSAASGQCQGIVNLGAVTTAINITGNQIGTAAQGYFTSNVASSGVLFGITSQGAGANCAISIQNNDIRGITYNVPASSSQNLMTQTINTVSQNFSGNTFTNLNINTTGSILCIANSVSLPVGGSKLYDNNRIVGSLTKGGSTNSIIFINDLGLTSPNGSTSTTTNNVFSNVNATGTTGVFGINNQDGNSSADAPTKVGTGNTVSNITHTGTGAITAITFDFGGSTNNVSNNIVSNLAGGGAITGMLFSTSNNGVTAANNSITGLSSTGAGGAVIGLQLSSAGPNGASISQNTISGLSSTAAASAVTGIAVTAGGTIAVSKNKICDLSESASTATTPMVNGILLSGGTTVNASNNLVGNLTAPASTSSDAIRGISVTSAVAATSYNLYFNTIYLSASSSGAGFGTSGLFHTANALATTAALDSRDNIIDNNSVAGAGGLVVAYRRSGAALNNYALASDRNLFYAGAPSASQLIFSDGTGAGGNDQTLAAYQGRATLAPRDANSVTENPPFLSTTCGDPNFLHINGAIGTQVEGGGAPAGGIADDYDSQARNGVRPDIGADEGTFSVTIFASAGPGGSISPSGNVFVTSGNNQTFNFTPNACQVVADVVVDNVSRGASPSYTFSNVVTGHTISVTFMTAPALTIDASALAGGSITPSGLVPVNCGNDETFAIAADGCHTIADVVVDGLSRGAVASYMFLNVQTNHTIVASFNIIAYTIDASVGPNGSIAPIGLVSVDCNDDKTFAITPDPTYSILDVVVDGTSRGAVASYTFLAVNVNHTITATFIGTTHTIFASAGTGGSITPNGAVVVGEGATVAFSIAADGCHNIADVVVDGISRGAVASYTFVNVTTDHTIAASFSVQTRTIDASAGPNGSISPNGLVAVNCGSDQTFSISAATCFQIADVIVDGTSRGAVASYTFLNVTVDHTITASFSQMPVYILETSVCYPTISAGITAATPGQHVVAAAGTYNENLVLRPNVSLTGAQAGVPACGRVGAETIVKAVAPATPVLLINQGGASIVIDGFTFDQNNGAAVNGAVDVESAVVPNMQFKNNRIINFKSSGLWYNRGSVDGLIQANSIDGSSMVGNGQLLFMNGPQSFSGIHVIDNCLQNSSATGWFVDGTFRGNVGISGLGGPVISGNTIKNCAGSGWNAGSRSLDGATISNNLFQNNGADGFQGGPRATTFSGNTFDKNKRWGLALTAFGNLAVDRGSINVTVKDNFFTVNDSAGYFVSATQAPGNAASTHANHNDIVNNGSGAGGNRYGAIYRGAETFDVGCNWWGDIGGPNYPPGNPNPAGDKLFGSAAQFSPWLDGSITGSPSCNQFLMHTILASAGAGGTITPSGTITVSDGATQAFAIAANPCNHIVDVVVDGVSRGAVANYTFTNIVVNHTITASFAIDVYTIDASAGAGGSITPSGLLPVNCGSDETFSIAANSCFSIADVVVDGTSRGALSSYTFLNVQTNHTISATFSPNGPYTILASAGPNGTITPSGSVIVNCGDDQAFAIAPAACYHVVDVLVDANSVGAVTSYTFLNVQTNHTISATFAANTLATTAITDLAAPQLRTGNDADGTTKIQVNFTTPAGAASVELWRNSFGGYPLYDNAGGVTPPAPGPYPPGGGWTQVSPSWISGTFDEPATRDFYYYVAYAKDACNNVTGPSNVTGGTLNYHLGDVTNGTPGLGDNTVGTIDVSLLGMHYGLSGVALAGFEYLDVGPTTDNSVNGRPTTDSKTNFDDLVMFALNYTPVASLVASPGQTLAKSAKSTAVNELRIGAPASVVAGAEFDVTIDLKSSAGDLQALSVALGWDDAVVKPIGTTAGAWVAENLGVALSPAAGCADVALLSPRSGGMPSGGGLATVRFQAVADGSPRVTVAQAIGRDASNQPVDVRIPAANSGVDAAPVSTDLMAVVPNPAPGHASLDFSMSVRGRVDLAVYSVDGRRVRSIAQGVHEVGRYHFNWNGTDDRGVKLSSGVYFIRLDAPSMSRTRRIVLTH